MDMTTALVALFPQGTPGYVNTERNSFEMNGLAANTQPQNCTILYQGMARTYQRVERREHYIVSLGTLIFEFRICAAYPDSGYDEFATGSIIADTAKDDADTVATKIARMKERIDSLGQ